MANVVRWRPFEDLVSLREAMDRLFEESFVRPTWVSWQPDGGRALPIDMYQTDDDVVVKARLAGLAPKDVDISLDGDVLTIRAELKSDATAEESDKWNWLHHELYHGPVSRSVALPTQVQADKAEARFENGLLVLTIPKAEEVKPKSIKVKAK